jgi:hypothetical protein
MNDILLDFQHKFVTVNLDDACICIRTLDEHMEHMRLVLQQFKEEGLKLRRSASSAFMRWNILATLCKLVKLPFRQRNEWPFQTSQCLRRRRRFAISCDSATSTPNFITLATFWLH